MCLFLMLSLSSCASRPVKVEVKYQPLPAELVLVEDPCTLVENPKNKDLAEAYYLCFLKLEAANARLKAIKEITN
jgi:hypothetical protein